MCVCAAKCCRQCMRVCVCCGMLLSNGWPKVTRRLLQHAMHGGREGGGGLAWLLAAGISYIDLLMSGMHYLPRPPPFHTVTQCFYFFVHKCRHIGSGWRWFVGAGTGRGCNNSSSTFLTASISYFQFCMCNFNAGGERETASEGYEREGERDRAGQQSEQLVRVCVLFHCSKSST